MQEQRMLHGDRPAGHPYHRFAAAALHAMHPRLITYERDEFSSPDRYYMPRTRCAVGESDIVRHSKKALAPYTSGDGIGVAHARHPDHDRSRVTGDLVPPPKQNGAGGSAPFVARVDQLPVDPPGSHWP
jgi:hypothetical protein